MAPTPTGTAFCIACPRVRKQPRGVGDGEGAGGGKRGIFAERMAGDELRVAFEIETGFGFQHAQRGKRDRHQRRLRILGERAAHRPGPRTSMLDSLSPSAASTSSNTCAGRRKFVRQRLAHADRLAALARKYESDRHTPSQLVFCLN